MPRVLSSASSAAMSCVGQGEVEDLGVLLDPLAVGRLGDDGDAVLQAPAQQHLGRGAAGPVRDLGHPRVAQVAAGAERAVGLEHDVRGARHASSSPRRYSTALKLDLVDGRGDAARRDHLVEVGRAEVGHADRPGEPALLRPLHAGPRPHRAALRPVHQVQVHLVDAELAQALLGLGDRVLAARVELGGDEHLVARHAAVPQRLADAGLVAVGLRGVDVPVTELKRHAHGVRAGRPVGNLPDAEPEHGQLVSVGKLRELHVPSFRRDPEPQRAACGSGGIPGSSPRVTPASLRG